MAHEQVVLMQHTLTEELLRSEAAEARELNDPHLVALARAHLRRLGEMPDGFRVERTRADVRPGRDPGLELTLYDDRGRPPRMVGVVARRRIGESKISWTAVQLRDADAAEAFALLLMMAAADAEARA